MPFTIPPASHPIWKIGQSLIGLTALIILLTHGLEGGHTGGVDVDDAIGAAGGGLALNVVRQLVSGLFSKGDQP